MTLDECRESIGQKVVYHAPHLDPSKDRGEEGTITSVNEVWAFVRYGSNTHSKATPPANLTKVSP